jgi:DNA-binding NarL/FixJ family response regulator
MRPRYKAQIIKLLGQGGLSNKEIADQLGCSTKTVANYRSQLRQTTKAKPEPQSAPIQLLGWQVPQIERGLDSQDRAQLMINEFDLSPMEAASILGVRECDVLDWMGESAA